MTNKKRIKVEEKPRQGIQAVLAWTQSHKGNRLYEITESPTVLVIRLLPPTKKFIKPKKNK